MPPVHGEAPEDTLPPQDPRTRLRRSVLFTPGTRSDRYAKALQEGTADTVVADLEDAVAPGDKDAARHAVVAALQDTPPTRSERAVRINAWPGGLGEADLAAVVPAAPQLIVVPKAEDPETVERLSRRIDELERDAGLPEGSIALLLIVETAKGVLAAQETVAASARVAGLAFGAEDLAADAGMRRTSTNAEVQVPRSLVALAATAARVQAIDMICADFRDLERTAHEATEARGLGYTGKMCLHPAQVVAVHEALRPTGEEEAWARRVVAAADNAGAARGGIVVVEGQMVDVPLVAQARCILQAVERQGA